MTENIKKLYVNGNIVAIGDYKIEEKTEPAKYNIKVHYDECASNPHEHDNTVVWYSNHRDYRLDADIKELYTEDGKTIDDFGSIHSFINALNEQKGNEKHYFFVSAYIHSGIALYKGEYTGPDARWDSGIFAIVEVNHKGTREEAKKIFDADFENMNAYITGEVYYYTIHDEVGEFVDSVGGFYGNSAEEIAKSMKEHIADEYNIGEQDIVKAIEEVC